MLNFFKPILDFFRSIDEYISGYDVFISYKWADGREYAETLADNLKKRGYRCFLDSSEYQVGDDLNRSVLRAVKYSRALVVVISNTTLGSKHVRKEIEHFEISNKAIVPIDIDKALYQRIELLNGGVGYEISEKYSLLLSEFDKEEQADIKQTFSIICRDAKLQIEEQNIDSPSPDTIAKLCKRFDFTRIFSRRLRVIGLTCFILASLAFISLVALDRAEHHRSEAEQSLSAAIDVAKTITENVDHKLLNVPGAEPLRDELLGTSYELLESLLKRSPRNDEIKLAQADNANHLGVLHFKHRSLDIAKVKFEEALDLYNSTSSSLMDKNRVLLNLGRTNRDLLLKNEAKQSYDQVLNYVSLFEHDIDSLEYKAQALYGLGDLLIDSVEWNKALEKHLEAYSLRQSMLKSISHDAIAYLDSLHSVGESADRIAYIYDQNKDLLNAKKYHEETYRIAKTLRQAQPGNGQYRREYALAASRLGYDYQRLNKLEKALGYYQESESVLQRLVEDAPTSKQYRYNWAIALSDLGDIFFSKEKNLLARKHYLDSLKELDRVLEQDPDNPIIIGQKVVTLNAIALLYEALNDIESSVENYLLALEITEHKILKWPNIPKQHYTKAIILKNISAIYHDVDIKKSQKYLSLSRNELEWLVSNYPSDQRFSRALKKISQ
ncbi:MAG: toll/interleukin-1 receptor domain-containing protein [Neptuniibacter sp.]